MKCGTPVLTSKTGSAPEVSGGHALLVNPYDVEDIKEGMEEIIEKPPIEKEKAKLYSEAYMEKNSGKTLSAYAKFL